MRARSSKEPLVGVAPRQVGMTERAGEAALRPEFRESLEESVLSVPTPSLAGLSRVHDVRLADRAIEQMFKRTSE